jgi:hypothetical protein
LLATNHRRTTLKRLEAAIAEAAGRRRIRVIDRPALPPDFAGDAEYSKSLWIEA